MGYICIHGHFYQPPRENPWLEAIELQESAHPYHDWNERITAECLAPNVAARILDGEEQIIRDCEQLCKDQFQLSAPASSRGWRIKRPRSIEPSWRQTTRAARHSRATDQPSRRPTIT